VRFNLDAFNIGRLCVHAPEKIEQLLNSVGASEPTPRLEALEDIIAHRSRLLTDYQGPAYAQRYKALMDKVIVADGKLPEKQQALSKVVARYAAKLMAYKDEYEVARLYTSPEFMRQLKATFQGDIKLKFNLAPPLLSKTDKYSGLPKKKEYGGWMMWSFKLLKHFRFLRGTKLDIFGYNPERKLERQLVEQYFQNITRLCEELDALNYDTAVELASLPEHIRGFGHVKDRHLKQLETTELRLWRKFENGGVEPFQADRIAVHQVEHFEPSN